MLHIIVKIDFIYDYCLRGMRVGAMMKNNKKMTRRSKKKQKAGDESAFIS